MRSSSFTLLVTIALAFSATQVSARGSEERSGRDAAVRGVADAEPRNFLNRQTVVEVIASQPAKFGALTAALVATDLVSALVDLSASEDITVMAPLNSAFCRLGAKVLDIDICKLDDFLGDCKPECWVQVVNATASGGAGILSNILLSHVVVGELSLRDLKRAKTVEKAITTLGTYVPNGELFYFTSEIGKNGFDSVLCKILAVKECFDLYADGGTGVFDGRDGWVKPAEKAKNGVVWPIDSILDPLTAP